MIRTIGLTLLFLSVQLAHAGGSVSMQTGDGKRNSGTVGFEYSGTGNARFSFDDPGQEGYMLINGGKAYIISGSGSDRMIMDMAELGAMAAMFRQQMPQAQQAPSLGKDDMASVADLTRSGGKEKVAGIQGEVYTLKWKDGTGRTHTDELILSSDRRVVAYTKAWMDANRVMLGAMQSGAENVDTLGEMLEDRKLGFLRMGDDMAVTAVSDKTPPASRFDLPGPVTSMADHGAFPPAGGGMPYGGPIGGAGPAADPVPAEQDDPADSQAGSATGQAVNEAIQKSLDGFVKGIFGR